MKKKHMKTLLTAHIHEKLLHGILPILLFMTAPSHAQIVLVDQCSGAPASGSGSNAYGPMYSVASANATSRTAVIYPASQLTALAGQTITGTYFYRLTAAGAMAGTPSFKIYFKEVSNTDWGNFGISWASTIAGATLVYNSNPAAATGTSAGWKNFASTTNFVYSGTQNLAVLMEYVNTTASTAIQWTYEYSGNCIDPDNFNTTKYINNTTGTPGSTLSSTNEERPYIGFDIAVSCFPPTNVAVPAVNITTTSATINWTASSSVPAGGYEYYYGNNAATPNASTTPSGSTAAGITTKDLAGLTPGTSYNVWVRAVCAANNKSPWTNKVKFNTLITNDEAAGAIPLIINTTTTCTITKAGITNGATQSPDAASGCYDDEPIEDVWYSFVATNSWHIISFSNVTSGNMISALYTGSPGSLQPLVCIDDISPHAKNLVVGQTYYLRVYTYPPAVGPIIQTDFTICVSTAPPPPLNDNCTNAISLTVNPTAGCAAVTTGTLQSATPSQGPASSCGEFEDDVWYKFIATKATHIITLQNVDGAATDMAFQVLSDCGATSALLCSDPQTNIVPGLTPGNTYYVRVATFGYVEGLEVTFDICVSSPEDMAYVSSTTVQLATTSVAAGSADQQIIRVGVLVSGANNALTLTQLNFNTNGSTTAANIASAKVYYTGTTSAFSNAVQFGNSVSSPNGVFAINGSQVLQGLAVNATNYFWLVYDIACNAVVGNSVDAECTSLTLGSVQMPAVSAPAGARTITAATYTATVTQASTAAVPQGTANAQVLRVTATGCANTNVTSISFTTTGSTNAATSIVAAKVFYTTGNSFATTTLFGNAIANPTGAFVVTGLQPIATGTGYFWLVYDIYATATIGHVVDATCTAVQINGVTATPPAPAPSGSRTIVAALVNDDAPGAVLLTVGANCNGAVYSNAVATHSANEPFPSCSGVAKAPVWFKFVAPASGAVRISTDVGSGNSMSDSKIGLFSAGDVNDYNSFSIIACDDDGGSVLSFGGMSVLYATGLAPGVTYFIAVDKGAGFSQGTFCITVAELAASMLSSTNTCANISQAISYGYGNDYTGWLSLVDEESKLIALVKAQAGIEPSDYEARQNVYTGPVRNANGTFYLNRSFSINHPAASNVQLRLFFPDAELAALTAADPSINLGNLSASRQSNGGTTCFGTFSSANGSVSLLPQTENGTAAAVRWIGITTPGFSNFYLNKMGAALPVSLLYFNGKKSTTGNLLSWKVNCSTGNNQFEIERSADAVNFGSIGIITADANACSMPFELEDNHPLPAVNYYRLKMADADGKISYSNLVAINNRGAGFEIVSLTPTIVITEAMLHIVAAKAGKMQLFITDMMGKQLQVKTVYVSAGSNIISLNCSQLSAGIYNLTCIDAGETHHVRFMKH